MMFANATNFYRKSGVAQWRDLRFSFLSSTIPSKDCPFGSGSRKVRSESVGSIGFHCDASVAERRRVDRHFDSRAAGYARRSYDCASIGIEGALRHKLSRASCV
jgi:hypothetical protein